MKAQKIPITALMDTKTMTISTILNFLIVSIILTSIFSITATNSVISVIFLITTFVQVALYLILLGINFIAISYIVIYVGAIAVLFLFVIMMINIKLTDVLETGNNYTKTLPLAINIVILFFFIIYAILPSSYNNIDLNSYKFENISNLSIFKDNINIPIVASQENNILNSNYSDLIFTYFSEIEVLGHNLYTYGAILLIILSIILLLAMLATIVLSKKNKNI
jgi:NADH-ubiquinone oxidoreductase chain 6